MASTTDFQGAVTVARGRPWSRAAVYRPMSKTEVAAVNTTSMEKRASSVTTPVRSDDRRSRCGLDDFVRASPRLFAVAHRIVGNVQEAEDVLQGVWLRWQRLDH